MSKKETPAPKKERPNKEELLAKLKKQIKPTVNTIFIKRTK